MGAAHCEQFVHNVALNGAVYHLPRVPGTPSTPHLDEHYRVVCSALADGNLVPFLGAGVNMIAPVQQPARGASDAPPPRRLPGGVELARLLAGASWPEDKLDLLRVSQYVELMRGDGPLYSTLRNVFVSEYTPTLMHQFLVNLRSTLRARQYSPRHPLILTTNYDRVLERSYELAGQEFDQVTYIAKGANQGKFLHRKWRKSNPAPTQPQPASVPRPAASGPVLPAPGEPTVIERPNEYRDPDLDGTIGPVILKIHGAVDVLSPMHDSYVITEDDYIEYLARPDLQTFLPVTLHDRLVTSHILFLGYSLRDWNLRVILRRMWQSRKLSWASWAIQRAKDAEELDRRFWSRHGVEIIPEELDVYLAELQRQLDAMTPDAARG